MATDFPTSLDNFTNPTSSDNLDSPSHSAQHANANDAIEAIEAKVGITGVGFNPASASAPASLDLHEDTDNGTNKITITAPSAVASDKTLTLPDVTDTLATASGWNPADETWTYASVDDPTGVITISGDKTSKYSAGMRIRFVNGGNTIHGIITAVAYSDPNTSITFLHEIDPTDSLALVLIADSAITAPFYSTQKAPFGFPLAENKWTVQLTDVSNRTSVSPGASTWVNTGSLSITIPIGDWDVSYNAIIGAVYATGGTLSISSTLSKANNTEDDIDFTAQFVSATSSNIRGTANRGKPLSLSAKDTYYLNLRCGSTAVDSINNYGAVGSTIIRAVCSYL
jgi:hypothetical protein